MEADILGNVRTIDEFADLKFLFKCFSILAVVQKFRAQPFYEVKFAVNSSFVGDGGGAAYAKGFNFVFG
jgi:hypothetical protein